MSCIIKTKVDCLVRELAFAFTLIFLLDFFFSCLACECLLFVHHVWSWLLFLVNYFILFFSSFSLPFLVEWQSEDQSSPQWLLS